MYPKISIITPSYNQDQFLEETIQSVLEQYYPNLEYIIIDGGSIDHSIDIIKKYDKYITYWVSEKDNGQAHAINKGFKHATGEILAYINSDDTYLPNAFFKVQKFFQEHSYVDLVYGDCNVIDANGRVLKRKREIEFDYMMGCFIGFGIIIPQPAAFWRRKILSNVGLLDEQYDYSMDQEYWFRIAQQHTIKHISELLANFRLHNKAKTTIHMNKPTPEYIEENNKVIKHAYNTLGISKIIPFKYATLFRKLYRLKRIILKLIYGKYDFIKRKRFL